MNKNQQRQKRQAIKNRKAGKRKNKPKVKASGTPRMTAMEKNFILSEYKEFRRKQWKRVVIDLFLILVLSVLYFYRAKLFKSYTTPGLLAIWVVFIANFLLFLKVVAYYPMKFLAIKPDFLK